MRPGFAKDKIIVVNLSGRGDKDVQHVARIKGTHDMLTRISKTFKRLKKQGKKAFIPYMMAGDPSLEKTKDVVLLFEECGADIVELGVPFSDPLADGPTIQRASERALEKWRNLKESHFLRSGFETGTQIPLVLMTYFNPVFKYGIRGFYQGCRQCRR